jgi:hypothetical protein
VIHVVDVEDSSDFSSGSNTEDLGCAERVRLTPANRHFWTERALVSLFERRRLRFRGLVAALGDAGTRLA